MRMVPIFICHCMILPISLVFSTVENPQNKIKKETVPEKIVVHAPEKPITPDFNNKISEVRNRDLDRSPESDILFFNDFFSDSEILYQVMKNDGHFRFGNDRYTGNASLILNSEGIYMNDADLDSHSTFTDKQLILGSFMYLTFKLRYQTWLETVISIKNSSYMGSSEENLNYFQTTQPYINRDPKSFNINLLYINFNISKSDDLFLDVTLGRQFLNHIYLREDFFYNVLYPDKINGLLVKTGNQNLGTFHILAMDVLNLFENWAESPRQYDNIPLQTSDIIGNYNGDIFSFRSGVLYNTPNIIKNNDHIQWIFYLNSIFTRYGPVISGVDRSGKSGSFTDNDYLFHYGLGTFFRLYDVVTLVEICRSEGIDRKPPDIFGNLKDISTNGYFIRLGIFVILPKIKGITHDLRIDSMFSEGPKYDTFGNKKSYGFVSAGNHEFGGFLLNNIWGFRPYSLSLDNGIVNHLSYGYYHSSGALAFNIRYQIYFDNSLSFHFKTAFLYDTSIYGDSKDIFLKNTMFEKFENRYIGNENSVTGIFSISPVFQLYLTFDVFTPGKLYQYFNHGIYENKKSDFYGIMAGVKVQF